MLMECFALLKKSNNMNHVETQAYNFAMSSFARMYGVRTIQSNHDVHKFCRDWATSGKSAPLGTLTKVDFYFRDLWV